MNDGPRVIPGAMQGQRPVEPRAESRVAPPSWSLKPCIAYLLIEFGRPMGWFPPFGLIRPGMLVGIWAFAATLSRGMRREIPRPLWYMFAFIALMAFHVPLAVNNAWAFWAFQDFAILVLGGVLPLAMLPRNFGDAERLATLYVLFHLSPAIYGLMHAGHGAGGWQGDENDLAFALNAAIGVGIYLLIGARGFGRKLLLAGSVGVMVAGVVASKSRGGFIGMSTLGLYLLLAGPKRGRILLAIVLAAVCLVAFAPPDYWTQVESIWTADQKGDTGESRIYSWKMGWRMFLDYPIFGVGTKNYGIRAPEYEDNARAVFGGQHMWGREAHSLYFTLIPEHGLVGITLFTATITWCFGVFRRLRRHGREHPDDPASASASMVASGLMAGLVGSLVTGAFISVLYYPVIWVLVGLLAALDAVRGEEIAGATEPDSVNGENRSRFPRPSVPPRGRSYGSSVAPEKSR